MEFSHTDTTCFELFLKEVSEVYPDDHHVIQVDNATFHTGKMLQIPHNISLIFQPSHSPECNPIERVWQWLKDNLKTYNFTSLEKQKEAVREILDNEENEVFQSITLWPHIKEALERN